MLTDANSFIRFSKSSYRSCFVFKAIVTLTVCSKPLRTVTAVIERVRHSIDTDKHVNVSNLLSVLPFISLGPCLGHDLVSVLAILVHCEQPQIGPELKGEGESAV